MNELTTKQAAVPWPAILALVVDVATIVVASIILPDLITRLSTPNGVNTLILGAFYVLFAVGVYLVRRLEPMPGADTDWAPPGVRGVLAVLFGLVLTTAIAWQLGFFSAVEAVNMDEIGEGPASAFFVFGPGAWLGFSMLYILVLAFRVTPTVPYHSLRYAVYALVGLLTSNVLLVLLSAQAGVILPPDRSWAWAIPAALILLLLFAPPRLFYVTRTLGLRSGAGLWTLATFVALIVASCWLVFVA